MNRRQKGNALSQYGIIIGLVALAAVPAFLLFGNQVVSGLTSYVDQYTNMNGKMANNIDNVANSNNVTNNINTTNTSAGNNSNNVSCSATDNTCSIDFGDFKLNGVPQNLNELVETSGTSAGTEAITNILNQIAQQLESEGVEGYQDFKDLANLGFFATDIIKKSENMFNECESSGTSYANFYECPAAKLMEIDNSTPPANVTTILPNYNSKNYSFSNIIEHAANLANGKVASDQNDPKYQDELIKIEAYQRYQSITDNPNLSQSVKNVAKELYWYLSEISFNHYGTTKALLERPTSSQVTAPKYDPFTGEFISDVTFKIDSKEDLLKPKTSLKTNLQDALICAAGSNTVIDNSCH